MIIHLYCRCAEVVTVAVYLFFLACLIGRVSRHTWLIYLYCRCAEVVTVAVYLFFLACLMGRQSPDTPGSSTCIANVLRW